MDKQIKILDCTLRDGAYVVESQFGIQAIKGIIKKLQDSKIDIIECGWLKNHEHMEGSSFYHVPSDMEQYFVKKDPYTTYVAMIDWDRYDLDYLPDNDGKTIDAIRVVFPQKKFHEGIALGKIIKKKGYQVYFQAANTLGYNKNELISLAEEINSVRPVALSVVDTFGAMFPEDLARIITILDEHLDKEIEIGFHAHNNQQLAFALAMDFVAYFSNSDRKVIIDGCLCGMGRGAGNTPTELIVNFLNRKYHGNYDMDCIMDAIDMYMGYFQENFIWGYSIPYFISGIYCAHVNNIAYLQKNHRTNAKDMRNIIEALSKDERKKYDYDLLEEKYLDHQNKIVDDETVLEKLKSDFFNKKVLLLLPGSSLVKEKDSILDFIRKENPVVIGVNAIQKPYQYDYLFFSNKVRYDYAKDIYTELFQKYEKIVASNIKTKASMKELIVNFNHLVKRGWEHFDNSGIMCLRLLNKLHVTDIALAGFDGFENAYSESYADPSLPHINPGKKWNDLNNEIKEMFHDFKTSTGGHIQIKFVTKSRYAD